MNQVRIIKIKRNNKVFIGVRKMFDNDIKVGIIGLGRVGTSLFLALYKKGIKPFAVFTKTNKSLENLNDLLSINYTNDLDNLIINSDIIFISIKDDEIEKFSENISKKFSRDIKGKVFVHLSGLLNSEILDSLGENGAFIASLHPIQTFPNKNNSYESFYNINFGFEGEKESLLKVKKITEILNGNIIIIKKEDKTLYHIAACVLSNYYITLNYIAQKLIDNTKLRNLDIAKVFEPLLKRTIDNVKKSGSVKALTGPISRGDIKIIEKHLKEIEEKEPSLKKIYKSLGEITLEIANKKGSIDDKQANALKEILGE